MAEDKSALTAQQVDVELQSLEGWTRDGVIIQRDFVLANFRDITAANDASATPASIVSPNPSAMASRLATSSTKSRVANSTT